MARTVGGAIPGRSITVTPKSGYTPVKNDLVIWDTTANYNVDKCAQDENPVGRIDWVSPDATYMTMELFAGGMIAVLPYSAAPNRGVKIEVGATANQIATDDTNGVGKVVAVDRITGYADVYFG